MAYFHYSGVSGGGTSGAQHSPALKQLNPVLSLSNTAVVKVLVKVHVVIVHVRTIVYVVIACSSACSSLLST